MIASFTLRETRREAMESSTDTFPRVALLLCATTIAVFAITACAVAIAVLVHRRHPSPGGSGLNVREEGS